MAGLLQIKRGTVNLSNGQLQLGEFYVNVDSCIVQVGKNSGQIITLVPLNCLVSGDINLTGGIGVTGTITAAEIGRAHV